MGYIDVGKKEGAKLMHGGDRALDKGYFIQVRIASCFSISFMGWMRRQLF